MERVRVGAPGHRLGIPRATGGAPRQTLRRRRVGPGTSRKPSEYRKNRSPGWSLRATSGVVAAVEHAAGEAAIIADQPQRGRPVAHEDRERVAGASEKVAKRPCACPMRRAPSCEIVHRCRLARSGGSTLRRCLAGAADRAGPRPSPLLRALGRARATLARGEAACMAVTG